MIAKTALASEIAHHLNAILEGPDKEVTGVAPLGEAGHAQLSFASDPVKYAESLATALESGAVVLLAAEVEFSPAAGATVIRTENPRGAFALSVAEFFQPRVEPGIAATAKVHPTANVASTAHVGEFSVIGADVVVGENVEIRNHVVIARGVQVGAGSVIKSHAVIGEEGFGIDKDANGNNIRLPHIGSVRIGENVEVGNFTTVCSGTIVPTTIGDYTKIDDHVHIAHNCVVGRNAIITACAEISGSVTIEDDVWIGPNASLIQGITVGKHALIGIGAVVTRSVPGNEVQFGNPAKRFRDNV